MVDRGVYLDVFEQLVLTSERNYRQLSFLASVSAELIVVSVLIIIPLTYNEHLPDFHWKSIGVETPLKRVAPKPIPADVLRRVSTGVSVPRLFTGFSLLQSPRTAGAIPAPESWDSPRLEDSFYVGAPSPVLDISGRVAAVAPPPPMHEAQPQKSLQGPRRVSAGVQMAKLLKRVLPEYPPLAKSARISGVVHLIGVISRDGTIRNLQLVSGHPLLARAALEAVEQWVYQPTLLSGEPVEVIAPIDVYFTLGQ